MCERVIIINSGRVGLNQYLDEMESKAVILVGVRGPAEQVAAALRGLQGVEQVSRLPWQMAWPAVEVHTHENLRPA